MVFQGLGIGEDFHSGGGDAILAALDELRRRDAEASSGSLVDPRPVKGHHSSTSATMGKSSSPRLTAEGESSLALPFPCDHSHSHPHHRLTLTTFSLLTTCDRCHLHLHGLFHQGLMCQSKAPRNLSLPQLTSWTRMNELSLILLFSSRLWIHSPSKMCHLGISPLWPLHCARRQNPAFGIHPKQRSVQCCVLISLIPFPFLILFSFLYFFRLVILPLPLLFLSSYLMRMP